MTTPPSSATQADLPAGSLSLWQILGKSTRLYWQHWASFTRVLFKPMGYIMLGLYSGLILSHLFIDYTLKNQAAWAQDYIWLFLLIIFIIMLGPLLCFSLGAWKYAVYFGTLNLNAQEILEAKSPNFQAAYQSITPEKRLPYKQLLLFAYAVLPLLALSVILLFNILGAFWIMSGGEAIVYLGIQLVGLLIATLILLLWIALLIPLSFVPQIAVFEEHQMAPIPIFKRSATLVFKRFLATLGLQCVLFLATNYLIPLPIVFLLRLCHLTGTLDQMHQWIVGVIMNSLMDSWKDEPSLTEVLPTLHNLVPQLAQGWTDMTLMLVLTAFMLPWGTFAFTLLYQSICNQDQTSGSIPPNEN